MMEFLWDPAKDRLNRAKHGIDFRTASLVWDDPYHRIVFDRVESGEERWWAVGRAASIVIVVVVHAYPAADDDHTVRIIGARKATPRERRRYEQEAHG